MMHKKITLYFVLIGIVFNINAQAVNNDTIIKKSKFDYKLLIIPSVLIGYGAIGINNKAIKRFDYKIKDALYGNGHSKFRIDDYIQYLPILSVYGLNALGIEGKHNFKDRTIVLGTACLIMATTITTTKKIAAIKRPDSPTKNSFPSGHTATAFMGAEFLYQEYKDQSIWCGISGYALATTTAFFRIYNNRHWFTDVVAGAGIGILSAKIAYWIQPFINKTLFGNKENITGVVTPFYNGKEYGLGVAMAF